MITSLSYWTMHLSNTKKDTNSVPTTFKLEIFNNRSDPK